MDVRACAMTGHRNITHALERGLEKRLLDVIEELAAQGTEVFYTGGAQGFDTLAALCVLRLRDKLGIRLCVCVPFEKQDRRFDGIGKDLYRRILSDADEVVYVSDGYGKNVYHKRNRYMVDRSEVCVAFLESDSGGTFYTVEYARRKGKKIINLADELADI